MIFGTTTSLPVFIAMILIMGICAAAYCSSCAMTLTANWWPTKKGIVLGWSTMGIVLMSVVYAPLIPSAYASFGITGTEIGLAVIIAIVGIICLIFVKDTPEAAGTTPDGEVGADLEEVRNITKAMSEYKSPFTFSKIVKDRNSWFMALGVGLPLMVAMTYISTTIPALLSYGYSYPQAAAVFSVGGIVALIGSWAFGMIDQYKGTKLAVTWYIVFMIVAIFAAIFMEDIWACAWISGIILFCPTAPDVTCCPLMSERNMAVGTIPPLISLSEPYS